jgi:hypothetical protein
MHLASRHANERHRSQRRLDCYLIQRATRPPVRPGHSLSTRRKPALPLGIVTVVVVWLPPEAMPLAKGVKLPAASVGELSTEYVAPGMEVQVSVKWRLTLSYCHDEMVGGGGGGVNQDEIIVVVNEGDPFGWTIEGEYDRRVSPGRASAPCGDLI